MQQSQSDSKNRIAIVTGGGTGIGRAIAIALSASGAKVVVVGRTQKTLNGTVEQIEKYGGKGLAIATDVTKADQVNNMVDETLNRFGKVDILVNNAGGSAREKQTLFHESEEETWDYVIDLNIKGTFHCTRAVINHMIEKQGGKIVNIGSTAGMIGESEAVDYSSAKAAVIGFTKALAKEVAPHGINVNCVSPGEVQSGFLRESTAEESLRLIGLGRLGKPEEIAAMVVFLVSNQAAFITGQNYGVCGLWNIGGL
jgi:NAD(P)-dependent dehydrogenase (short-subunit alcohol dehydrogenase family)